MLFGAINNWKRLESRKRPGNNNILLYYISFFPHYPQAAMLTLQLTGPYSTGSIVSVMYSLYTPQQYQSSSAHSVRSLTQSLIWDHSAHCHKNIGPKRPWLFFLLDDCCWGFIRVGQGSIAARPCRRRRKLRFTDFSLSTSFRLFRLGGSKNRRPHGRRRQIVLRSSNFSKSLN
jgi:hypothetical protein